MTGFPDVEVTRDGSLPLLVITGSSGFIGRHLLEAIQDEYRIIGMARRSQVRSGAPVHPNIDWIQVDIGEREALERAFRPIVSAGPVEAVLHLAAHYDFTGEEHPEYWRTNVEGLRNILDLCREVRPRQFLFASSVAACDFPPPGRALDETSKADGRHIYAITKSIGEAMLDEYRERFPCTVLRFAALFSDWCEYPPFYSFLGEWTGRSWKRRLIGGHGTFAIPYLHIRDLVSFTQHVLARIDELGHGRVLIASPEGAVSVKELFEETRLIRTGRREKHVYVPRALCWLGMHVLDKIGYVLDDRPFERPWMARHIDRQLTVNPRASHEWLGWSPRARLHVVRRLPFLLEHLENDPVEWHRRNRAALRKVRPAVNLRINHLLERHEKEIVARTVDRIMDPAWQRSFPTYQRLTRDQVDWSVRTAILQLRSAVRTRDRSVFLTFCRQLAVMRYDRGFTAGEVCEAIATVGQMCLDVLRGEAEAEEILDDIHTHVSMTIRFGCDAVEETFENRIEERVRALRRAHEPDVAE